MKLLEGIQSEKNRLKKVWKMVRMSDCGIETSNMGPGGKGWVTV
jgi:hypothetical protein